MNGAFAPLIDLMLSVGLYHKKIALMQIQNFEKNIKVFGIEVKTFPAGIGEAFDELIKMTGDAAGKRQREENGQ